MISEGRYEKGSVFITQHENGLDWWICLLRLQSNCYDCILLDSNGFSDPVTSCSRPVWGDPSASSIGQGVGDGAFSPDGNLYVRFNFQFGISIYDFDNKTGILDHQEQIFLEEDDFLGHVGAAISPNSRYLYASALSRLYQFDLLADTIESSGVIVDNLDTTLPGNHIFRISTLGPDGKIYIAGINSLGGLHVIHHPDRAGFACEVEQLGLRLPAEIFHASGLPNNPWYGKLPNNRLCDSLVSVQDEAIDFQIDVFPNPATDHVVISSEDSEVKINEVKLYDSYGKLIIRDNFTSAHGRLELGLCPAGLYIMVIETSRGRVVEKIVVE